MSVTRRPLGLSQTVADMQRRLDLTHALVVRNRPPVIDVASITAAISDVEAAITALQTPRFSHRNRTTSQNVADATVTVASFSNSVVNQGTGYVDEGNTTVTVDTAGLYQIEASIDWASNGAGSRNVYVYVNGSPVKRQALTTHANYNDIITTVRLDPGDEVEIRVYQSSGGSLNIDGSVETFRKIRYVGGV